MEILDIDGFFFYLKKTCFLEKTFSFIFEEDSCRIISLTLSIIKFELHVNSKAIVVVLTN